MRQAVMLLLAFAPALSGAADPAEGRWSGRAQVPGREMPLIVDLARDKSGAWTGSLIVPGFDVKGATLENIKVAGAEISFDAGDTFGAPPDGPATFKAHLDKAGALKGELRLAGNAAPMELKRVGPAQVDAASRSTPVSRETVGRWIGEYEMGGYPRHVTVDIANEGSGPAKVEFVVVGKATTKVPIDFVNEVEGRLRIESRLYRIAFEGRIEAGKIEGVFEQGTMEVPLVLRRGEGKAS